MDPHEPLVDRLSEPFFAALADGELHLQHCGGCDRAQWYPRGHCARCASTDLSWRAAGGLGDVETFAVVRRNSDPGFDTPYVLAVIRLDEGVAMEGNVIDVAPEDVRVGMRVRFTPRARAGGTALPQWQPLAGAGR